MPHTASLDRRLPQLEPTRPAWPTGLSWGGLARLRVVPSPLWVASRARMSIARREINRRELLLAAAGTMLVALVMSWPLPLNLGETIPRDLGDPLPQAWKVAWAGHALTTQPLDFFQSNQFWPERDSFAFGDMLIGYAPFALFVDGPRDAVVRYDLAFLFAYALAFFGAYVLARELGVGPGGAAVAAAAFAFAPFRLEHDGHMQVISSGGIALALALGVRGIRLRSPWALLGAWAVAAWQVSLGFALGLPFLYLIALLIAIGTVVWWRRGRPPLERRLLAAGAGGALLFAVVVGMVAAPYFRIADRHPEAIRTPAVVEAFSDGPRTFLAAPAENSVWGGATASVREDLENIPEKTLFPGLIIVILAALGLGSSTFPRWLRIGLGAAVLVYSVLALGFKEEDGLLWPYRIVYELPGWDGIRTPGRLVTFSSLALALLAAAGTESLQRALRRRIDARSSPPGGTAPGAGAERGPAGSGRGPLITAALAGLLVLLIVVEGRGLPFDPFDDQAQPAVPYPVTSVADIPGPQLHLPAERAEDSRRYLLWSTDGFPRIVNGRASTNPEETIALIEEMRPFPDEATVERLRELGVRSVVLHTDRLAGTPQAGAEAVPLDGLGLARRELPGRVIYELLPPPAAPDEDG